MENQQHYEAYQRALKEGVAIPLKYLKVLFFGPPRTGKTSMRRRLVGEIQNLAKEHLQASTGTAERFDVIVKVVEEKIITSTTVVTKSSWSTVKALFGKKKGSYGTPLDEELLLLYEFIYGVVERRNPVSDPAIPHDEVTKGQSLKTDTVPSPASVKPSKTIRSSGSLFQELPSVEKPGYGLSDNEVEKVFEAFTKVLQTPRQKQLKLLLDGTVLLNMVDTGGQPAFLEMLPALTIGPALYLIFFRLDQGLNERYQIQFVSEDNKDIQLGESSYTVVEVIFQALSSIACFSCPAPRIANMPNPSHVAMFVGTHKDLLRGELEIKVKDDTLQENLKEVLDTDLFKADKNFLRYASNDQLMFAIDNMTGDEEELEKVRKRLEQVIKQEFDDFPIPASWLMFSIFLRKMDKRTLSLLQCKEIAGRLNVKNTDEALWFLHHCVGTLMYFPDMEELKDVVICDPQLIFDSVTDLILNSFKFGLVRKLACDKFKNAGMFRYKDIQKITRDSKSDSLPLPKLVKLLEYLNIIASIKPESPSFGHNSFPELSLLLDGTVLLNMVDTGGQPAFLEMLPALTIGPALYLIFFRLDQALNERYQIQFVSEDNKDIQLGESSYTVVEVIFQALSSIACFSCPAPRIANMPNPSHVAMFVGTHKDLLRGELEIKVKDDTLQENLKEVLDTDLFKADKNFLRYASNDQLMFAIDNMTGDEEELEKVRKRLEQVIKQEFDDFPIPASWLMFSIFLRKMDKRTLSLLQCKEIAGRLKVKNTDEALWFLHHCVGTLMYFPDIEELKDVVICDPQLIFDSVTDLILNSFKFDLVRKLACDKFNNAGMFRYKDIQKIARDSKSDSLPLPKLVKLLEYLNIIASIKPESPSLGHNSFSPDAYQEENLVYFMPAVLKNANEEELRISQSPTDPAPLMIQFKCGFVPVGVFCAIIASLVAKKHTIQWILQEPSKFSCRNDGYILCKNRVTFRINDGGTFDITLISKPKRYEIHIARISSVDITVEICQHVLETFCDTLDQVISKMKYKRCLISSPNPSDQTLYELGFKCPEHPCDDHLVVNRPKIERVEAPPQSARLVWLKGKSTIVCLKDERSNNFSSSPHFAQKISPWFGEVSHSLLNGLFHLLV